MFIGVSQAFSPYVDEPLKSVTHVQWDDRPRLPSQPQSVAADWLIPNHTAW